MSSYFGADMMLLCYLEIFALENLLQHAQNNTYSSKRLELDCKIIDVTILQKHLFSKFQGFIIYFNKF